MEFFIRQNSTLPIIKVQIIKDGRVDFREFDNLTKNSTITFTMWNEDNGRFYIVNKPAHIMIKESNGDSPDVDYYVYYQLSSHETRHPGRYVGEFNITNEQGEIKLPLRDKLFISVRDSISKPELCCKPNRGQNNAIIPSETPRPMTPTPTPSVSPSRTPLVSPSASPQPIPPPTPSSSVVKPSQTPTSVPTSTPTITPTITPTSSTVNCDLVVSGSIITSPTPTPSITPTSTPTITPTSTPTITPTSTPIDCGLIVSGSVITSPTPTPSITPTSTPSITPSVTSTITPSMSPSVTTSVTPSVTPTLTPTTPCCDTWDLYGGMVCATGTTFTYVDCDGLPQEITVPIYEGATICAISVINTNPGCGGSANTNGNCICNPTPTPTITPTITPTVTSTVTPTGSPSVSPSSTVTPTVTQTPSITPSSSPAQTEICLNYNWRGTGALPGTTAQGVAYADSATASSITEFYLSDLLCNNFNVNSLFPLQTGNSLEVSLGNQTAIYTVNSFTDAPFGNYWIIDVTYVSGTVSTSTVNCHNQNQFCFEIPPTPGISPQPTNPITSTPTPTDTPDRTPLPTPSVTTSITPTQTPTSTQAVAPSDPSLEIYYKSDLSSYFTPTPNSGDTFNQWEDSSANAHNANPIGGGTGPSPEWWSNQLNGLGGVYFNGTTDGLSVNPLTDLQSVTGQTIIVVARSLNSGATGQYLQGGSDGNTGLNEVFIRQSGGTYDVRTAFGVATGGVVDTNPHILTTVFSGSGVNNEDRFKFRIDGCEQSLTFTSNVSGTTNPLTDYVFMGVSYTTAVSGVEQYYYNGFLFDVLIYSRALGESELNIVESFVANKWGLGIGCPTPTPTPTNTQTPTPSSSVTPSVTPTNTPTSTVTPSVSPAQQNLLVDDLGNYIVTDDTDFLVMSTGPVPSPTPTSSVTATPTITPTNTATPTPSVTSSVTPTVTPTPSITPTNTVTPTSSVTPTITPTPSTSNVVPNSRILYYDFNDVNSYNGGGLVRDSELNSDGTVYNSGIFNDCYQSIEFNGTNGYVVTNNDLNPRLSPVNTSSVISIFTWFYPTGDGVIVSEQGSTIMDSSWYDSQIQIVNGVFRFAVWPYTIGSTSSPVITSSVNTPLNQWYYVGLTYNGSTLRAYINGQTVGSSTYVRQTPYGNGNPLHYALAYGTQTNFTTGQPYGRGRMGTFEVYNTSLSQTQIQNIYNSTLSQWVCPTPTQTPTPTSTPQSK